MTDRIDRSIEDAAGALRAETAGPSARAAETRARILRTHAAKRARASQVTTYFAMAAAVLLVLGGSTAWAYWSGALDAWLAPEAPAPEAPPDPVVEAPAPHATRPTPIAPPALVPAPELVPLAEPAPSAPLVEPVVETRAEDTTTVAPDEEPVDPAERRLYRAAHALHFDDHDPAGAIAAWDAYLRAYPRGRFALEARYNRALCLVRTDRIEEARSALEPFARGTHGGYRRAEAAALLEALGDE